MPEHTTIISSTGPASGFSGGANMMKRRSEGKLKCFGADQPRNKTIRCGSMEKGLP